MKDFKPHMANSYNRDWKKGTYFFNPESITRVRNKPMWITDFRTEQEILDDEQKPMHGYYANAHIVPEKVKPMKNLYEKGEWRSKWFATKPFEGKLVVNWAGFESNTELMQDCGWTIELEYNKFMGKSKLVFRNKDCGLICRVPYDESVEFVTLPKLYAVHNYTLKAPKFKESLLELTKEHIPAILECIREVKRPDIAEIVWQEKKEEAANKVVQLSDIIKAKQAA